MLPTPAEEIARESAKRRRVNPLASISPVEHKPRVTRAWHSEGPAFDNPFYLKRTDRYELLWSALERDPIVLVRSPPMTGKSSMCSEMAGWAVGRGDGVHIVSLLQWDSQLETYNQYFTRTIGVSLRDLFITPAVEGAANLLLIIDEFQMMYELPDTDPVWGLIKSHQSLERTAKNVFVLMFSAYGRHEERRPSPSESSSSSPLAPVQATSSLVHKLTPFQIDYLFDATFLSFTEEEFHKVIALYNENAFEADIVPIDSAVANFLFTFTAGHVGATSLSIWVIVHLFWTPRSKRLAKKRLRRR